MSDRWTIYVCSECHAWKKEALKIAHALGCPARVRRAGSTASDYLRVVEVCPVSELEALQNHLGELERTLAGFIRSAEDAENKLAALREDYDRFPAFVREVADELRGFSEGQRGDVLTISEMDFLDELADRLDPPSEDGDYCSTCGGSVKPNGDCVNGHTDVEG